MHRIILLVLAFLLMPGCSFLYKKYKHEGPANLVFTKTLEADGALSSIGAILHVSRPKPDCSDTEYLGLVTVPEKITEMSFPVGELLYFHAVVIKSEVLAPETYIYADTLFKAKQGYHYKLDVLYTADSYGYSLYEKPPSADSYRAIDAIPWSVEACRKMM